MRTINEVLVLMKVVRERLNGLKDLRKQVSITESYLYSAQDKKVVEPQYDVKLVDKKITELETWLFKADAAIKQSNAKTEINIETDTDKLLAPLT